MQRIYIGLLVWVFMFGFAGISNANIITQKFTNSWNVDVWDYYGDVSAMEWEYQPYLAALDNLESVELSFHIAVSGLGLGDDFRYRMSFFTGWSPAAYQFFNAEWFYHSITKSLIINENYLFTSPPLLNQWQMPLYGPNGNYYFESKSMNDSHTVNVNTKLTYNYTAIPEPSSILLFFIGMAGLVQKRDLV